MMDKKVTRKEFLLSALSIIALFIAGKVPPIVKNSFSQSKNSDNTYGNSSYGGNKKNV